SPGIAARPRQFALGACCGRADTGSGAGRPARRLPLVEWSSWCLSPLLAPRREPFRGRAMDDDGNVPGRTRGAFAQPTVDALHAPSGFFAGGAGNFPGKYRLISGPDPEIAPSLRGRVGGFGGRIHGGHHTVAKMRHGAPLMRIAGPRARARQ